jgi:hypothetical protein
MKLLIKLLFLIFFISFSLNSCKEKKTTTENSSETEVTKAYKCPMDCENGKIHNKPGICPACKMDLALVIDDETITCDFHTNGNCKCEGDKCACANCKEHSKKATCEAHKDGKCICEGDKCVCVNCKEHS